MQLDATGLHHHVAAAAAPSPAPPPTLPTTSLLPADPSAAQPRQRRRSPCSRPVATTLPLGSPSTKPSVILAPAVCATAAAGRAAAGRLHLVAPTGAAYTQLCVEVADMSTSAGTVNGVTFFPANTLQDCCVAFPRLSTEVCANVNIPRRLRLHLRLARRAATS